MNWAYQALLPAGGQFSVSKVYTLAADAGSFIHSGQFASGTVARRFHVLYGGTALSGMDAQFGFGVSFSVAPGQCALAGQSAGFARFYRLLANAGVYTATAIGTALRAARAFAGGFRTFTASGQSVAWSNTIRFPVECGVMTCDRQAAELYRSLHLQAEARTVNLAGQRAMHSIASSGSGRANSRQLAISIGI
ncbi:MAG: hypothetical protein P8Y47_09815 [Alphaproteobacteria bacterium]